MAGLVLKTNTQKIENVFRLRNCYNLFCAHSSRCAAKMGRGGKRRLPCACLSQACQGKKQWEQGFYLSH